MASVETKHKSKKQCLLCGKGDTVALNRPNSLHKTKRTVKPNLQKNFGIVLCQSCFRTIGKKGAKIA